MGLSLLSLRFRMTADISGSKDSGFGSAGQGFGKNVVLIHNRVKKPSVGEIPRTISCMFFDDLY